MAVPQIRTAIPQRRYQLGEFMVSVLGDVESSDGIEYRYIMAVARESEPQPQLFVSAERNGNGAGWQLRVSMAQGSQSLGGDEGLRDLDRFTTAGLEVVRKMLALEDEEPYRLL